MPPTNDSVQLKESPQTQDATQRNERQYVGDKELKFVIKLSCPIPG
jgi:hypothetical protein